MNKKELVKKANILQLSFDKNISRDDLEKLINAHIEKLSKKTLQKSKSEKLIKRNTRNHFNRLIKSQANLIDDCLSEASFTFDEICKTTDLNEARVRRHIRDMRIKNSIIEVTIDNKKIVCFAEALMTDYNVNFFCA